MCALNKAFTCYIKSHQVLSGNFVFELLGKWNTDLNKRPLNGLACYFTPKKEVRDSFCVDRCSVANYEDCV